MNSFEYIARKSIARFGVVAPRYYLRTATEENILLKEAETIIGKMAWRDLENVEELITEYWRIRQLDTEQIKLEEDMEKAKVDLQQAKQAAAHPETVHSTQLAEVLERIESERDHLTVKLHSLQDFIHKAEAVRKKFNGLKLKLTVLKAESAPAATLDAIRGDLQSVKHEYGELARAVENIRQEVKLFEDKIAGYEAEEANLRSRISHRELALTRAVSDISRRLIEISSRLGIIEGEKAELFATIGRLLRHDRQSESAGYRDVIHRFAPIIRRARSLARSIDFNRRLADYR